MNSLPIFLDKLAESLEQKSLKLATMKDVAQSHALQRATLEDYSLEQVKTEYTILRRVIFELLEESSMTDSQERNIILDFIAEGRLAASINYMKLAQDQITWGKIIWSETLIRIHGFAPGEFTGNIEDFWPRVHPEDREILQQNIDKSLKNKQDYQAEYRMIWNV